MVVCDVLPLLHVPSFYGTAPQTKIASILSAYGTEWHIVVGPNLRHEVLGPEDNETMLRIFGRSYHNLGRELAPMMADSTNLSKGA